MLLGLSQVRLHLCHSADEFSLGDDETLGQLLLGVGQECGEVGLCVHELLVGLVHPGVCGVDLCPQHGEVVHGFGERLHQVVLEVFHCVDLGEDFAEQNSGGRNDWKILDKSIEELCKM